MIWQTRFQQAAVVFAGLLAIGLGNQALYGGTPPLTSSTLKLPPGIAIAALVDLNGDQHLDLVTKSDVNGPLALALGDGTGRFAPTNKVLINLDFEATSVQFVDVNGDSILDVGVAEQGKTHELVHIYLGDRSGRFSEAKDSPVIVNPALKFYKFSMTFIDVNEDGKLDLVAMNGRRPEVLFFFGNGKGQFEKGAVTKLAGPGQHSFAVADMDSDGHLDLVIADMGGPSAGPGYVVVKRGNGQGSFEDVKTVVTETGAGVGPVVDVNGDGFLDVTMRHGERNLLSVALNDGRGQLHVPEHLKFEQPGSVHNIVAGDINLDRKIDLLASTVDDGKTTDDSTVTVLLGDGQGKFQPAPCSPVPSGNGGYILHQGDINEDGRVDVIVGRREVLTLLLAR